MTQDHQAAGRSLLQIAVARVRMRVFSAITDLLHTNKVAQCREAVRKRTRRLAVYVGDPARLDHESRKDERSDKTPHRHPPGYRKVPRLTAPGSASVHLSEPPGPPQPITDFGVRTTNVSELSFNRYNAPDGRWLRLKIAVRTATCVNVGVDRADQLDRLGARGQPARATARATLRTSPRPPAGRRNGRQRRSEVH
jgi:hypothetical protein